MLATHVSHFGLTKIGETEDDLIFEGSFAACKRLAHSHGCEVGRERGPILGSVGGIATHAIAPIVEHELTDERGEYAGLIMKGQGVWHLVIHRDVWERD